ncbi:hypothetical protein DMO16_14420 [Fictibacillus sp. S7]|nr:hypothetical protein DMO16_14420 [Fictibacillus sp. S7]
MALVVPESLYDRLTSYSANNDFYNVMYYGKKEIKPESEKYADLVAMVIDAAAEAKAKAFEDHFMTSDSLTSFQMISSLNDEGNEELAKMKEEIRSELFSKFAEREISIYKSKPVDPENPGEGNQEPDQPQPMDAEKAQQVLYYVGKYNVQNPGKDLNPNEYSEVDRVVMEAALKEQTDNLAAALNKFQMLAQFSPTYAESAKNLKDGLMAKQVEKARAGLDPREPGQYEPLPEGKELETLKQLLEEGKYAQVIEQGSLLIGTNLPIGHLKKVMGDAAQGLLEQTDLLASNPVTYIDKKDQIINNYRILTEVSNVPEDEDQKAESHLNAYLLMLQAMNTASKEGASIDDLSEAVIVASESVGRWETGASAGKLNELATQLLSSAKDLDDVKKEENVYELLSTTPHVSDDVTKTAFDRKKALAYSRKASDLLTAGHYEESIFYASESNQLYSKEGLNKDTLGAAANALFEQHPSGSFDDLVKVYRTIASATGMPDDQKSKAVARQEAIDNYKKAKTFTESDREKAVYYFDKAADSQWMAPLVDAQLQEQATRLLSEANTLKATGKDKDLEMAVRYYKTLLVTKHVNQSTRDKAQSAIDELKKKSTPASDSDVEKDKTPQEKPVKRSEPKKEVEKPQAQDQKETSETPKAEPSPSETSQTETPKEEVSEEEAPAADATDSTPVEEEAPLPESEQAVP